MAVWRERLSGLSLWWAGLSLRERVLVGVLATLLGLAVLIYGVVKPLQAARADAIADIRGFETLNARIRAAGTLVTAPQPQADGPIEAQVAAAASRAGVSAAIVPAGGGGARATIADARYDALIAFLADARQSSGVGITRADITRLPTSGHVAATIEFTR